VRHVLRCSQIFKLTSLNNIQISLLRHPINRRSLISSYPPSQSTEKSEFSSEIIKGLYSVTENYTDINLNVVSNSAIVTVSNMLLQATGLPLESKAGVQCNLVMRDVKGYDRVAPFSNKYIPLFWLQLVSVISPIFIVAPCILKIH
jgi:hypothetical protein